MRISDWSSDVCSSDLGSPTPSPRPSSATSSPSTAPPSRRSTTPSSRSRTSHVSARASAASPKSPTDQDSPMTDYVDSYYARTRADDLRREPLDGSVTAEFAVIGGGTIGRAHV